jgi:7,8-dihydropterin-6-yl-methyl-4-(beta-D-ribofuranosyl)aminobenzene 5'-phosphate synthase
MRTVTIIRTWASVGILWLALGWASPAGTGVLSPAQEQSPGLRVTYLYDNTEAVPGVQADWGFACLVEGRGGRVLFDTGAKPEVLRHNAEALRVDLDRLDAIVLSHDHGDHTAGFPALGPRPSLPVFYAQGFNTAVVASLRTSGARLVPVSKGVEVLPGFRTSDEFGTSIKEEALLLDTPDGLVIVVGCSHPGIVPMLQQIKASTGRPIHAVLGGFHLLQTPADEIKRIVAAFQELGIGRVGPTHCTGPDAIRLFKDAFGGRYIAGGVGTVVTVPQ